MQYHKHNPREVPMPDTNHTTPIPAYRALSNARIEQMAQAEERRLARPRPDTSTRAGWAQFLRLLTMRKLHARWGNTQAAKVRAGKAVGL